MVKTIGVPIDSVQKKAFLRVEGDNWFRRVRSGTAVEEQIDCVESILVDAIRRTVFPTKLRNIAEIGSSRGDRLLRIARALKWSGVGVDPSELAVEEGNRSWPSDDLLFRVGTADATNLEPESVTVLFFGWSLMYVEPELMDAVRSEILRILAPGGLVAVFDFDYGEPLAIEYKHDNHLRTFRRNYDEFLRSMGFDLVLKSALEVDHATQRTKQGRALAPLERCALWVFQHRTSSSGVS